MMRGMITASTLKANETFAREAEVAPRQAPPRTKRAKVG
jgi:hypothetical protein